ncbi:hypothetical protein VC83_09580 [Pseudogymnoascus destructans]|uniref:Retrovirus-related Pol polyprotein from transposon TNT 1-94-like beta-barrel domain-containing protein n=1 Tax=Pseudogymnoascus destructans TaxID=655981 RepID=A0A2P6FGG9_9PEZI|nr:uncharacterized protein VC83_09580 [Pseudogymnoascus destructans]PQM43453.1 hypothetical protein VC83_09580 [Pseudogymnoascus destructans]
MSLIDESTTYSLTQVITEYRAYRRQTQFRQKPRGEHGVFATMDNSGESSDGVFAATDENDNKPATLQGRTNRNTSARRCPCGSKHKWRDCYYIVESKRHSGWKPKKETEIKVRNYIAERPSFQSIISNYLSQNGSGDNSLQDSTTNPTAFTAVFPAFQVSQKPSSTYELAQSTILDSGATVHVCNDYAKFHNFKKCDSETYLLAGDQRVIIEGFGSVNIDVQNSNGQPITIALEETALVSTFHTSVASLRRFIKKGVHWNTKTECLTYRGKIFCKTPMIHNQKA